MPYTVSDKRYDVPGGTSFEPNGGIAGMWSYITGRPGPSGFGSSATAAQVAADWDGEGKVVLITGASAGLGLESARVLAARGAHVVMAVRDYDKAKTRAEAIKSQHPGATLTLLKLDLTVLSDVRRCAQEFKSLNIPLHVLMLNAGVMSLPAFEKTADGFETQFQTNHLGHFLLAELLTPTLAATARAAGPNARGRVIMLSSAAQYFAPVNQGLSFDTFTSESGYKPWVTYGRTKLCNVLHAREFNVRHAGEPVEAVCCHPGGILTELIRNLPPWQRAVGPYLVAPFVKTVQQGAATQVYLATAPKVAPGAYYQDCNVDATTTLAADADLGAKLWTWSEEHVKPKK